MAFLSAACSLNAQVLNGDFEAGMNNWDPNGHESECLTTSSHLYGYDSITREPIYTTIYPIDGQHFVMLKTGSGCVGDTNKSWTQLTQLISVNEGQSITGSYFFATDDWVPPWNDIATIYLSSPEPNSITGLYDIEILLARRDVNSVGSYFSMEDWERFSHTFGSSEAGDYMLVLRVEDAVDCAYASYLAVDALYIVDQPMVTCAYKLAGDVNRDCKVDLVDFAKMAENWLIDCNAEPTNSACTPI